MNKKDIMCDYTRIKHDKDEILQAGLNFLDRSAEANGNAKRRQSLEELNSHPDYTVSVQVAVQIMLKKAVKQNEDFMRQISHKEDFLLRAHGSRKRRGAACEENVLERDGLLELLKTYMKLMHLRAYSLI